MVTLLSHSVGKTSDGDMSDFGPVQLFCRNTSRQEIPTQRTWSNLSKRQYGKNNSILL